MIAEALFAFNVTMLSSKWNRRGVYVKFHIVASAVAAFAKYINSSPLDVLIGTFVGILLTDLLVSPKGTGRAGIFDALFITPVLSTLLLLLAT